MSGEDRRRQVNMRLPVALLEEIDRAVGERGRTEFVVRACRRELVRLAQVERVQAFRRASERRR